MDIIKSAFALLQIYDKAICKPLHLIFSFCIKSEIFPTEWKTVSVVPIHKRDYKHKFENYRPVSHLPIFGKIFEHLMYNEIYSFSIENYLISLNQSGFKQEDSGIN